MKTYFEGLEWTSDSGTGTTSFSGVYTYPNWTGDEGYPFVVILDNAGSGSSLGNRTLQFDTQVEVSLCVNYSIIDKQTDEDRAEEAMLRLREAWDYIKTQLFDYATLSSLGVDWTQTPVYTDDMDAGNNVYKRVITLTIKETIER